METATRPTSDPLPRCKHDNCLQDGAGERLEPPCGCHLTAPQETPAQQGLVGQVTKMLATEAYHYCSDCHSHCRQLILTVEALKESIRVNRDPAFQKLEASLEAITQIAGNLTDEAVEAVGGINDARSRALMVVNARRIAREALRLAREGEE